MVVLVTLIPSIYLGYDLVQQNRFRQRANDFIEEEAVFPNNFLLRKSIDPAKKSITLTYGGQQIEEAAINQIRAKLAHYGLEKSVGSR